MNRFIAEKYAVSALSWLSKNPPEVQSFLIQTGAAVSDLRKNSTEPAFLVSVLDFILASDRLASELSHELGINPGELVSAREHLPGGDRVLWT